MLRCNLRRRCYLFFDPIRIHLNGTLNCFLLSKRSVCLIPEWKLQQHQQTNTSSSWATFYGSKPKMFPEAASEWRGRRENSNAAHSLHAAGFWCLGQSASKDRDDCILFILLGFQTESDHTQSQQWVQPPHFQHTLYQSIVRAHYCWLVRSPLPHGPIDKAGPTVSAWRLQPGFAWWQLTIKVPLKPKEADLFTLKHCEIWDRTPESKMAAGSFQWSCPPSECPEKKFFLHWWGHRACTVLSLPIMPL